MVERTPIFSIVRNAPFTAVAVIAFVFAVGVVIVARAPLTAVTRMTSAESELLGNGNGSELRGYYPDWVEEIRDDVAAWDRARDPSDTWGMILGHSSALAGIDADRLERSDRPGMKWKLCALIAPNFVSYVAAANALDDYAALPRVAVLTLHLGWFAAPSGEVALDESAGQAGGIAGLGRLVPSSFEPMREEMQGLVQQLRGKVQAPLQSAVWASARGEVLTRQPGKFTDHLYDVWADPQAYRAGAASSLLFKQVLRQCRDRDVRVVIVLMPQEKDLTAVVPDVAAEMLDRILSEAFPDRPVPVIDFRDLLTERDGLMRDPVHASKEGRQILTDRLAEELLKLRES